MSSGRLYEVLNNQFKEFIPVIIPDDNSVCTQDLSVRRTWGVERCRAEPIVQVDWITPGDKVLQQTGLCQQGGIRRVTALQPVIDILFNIGNRFKYNIDR
jgi:hypothetical protein